MANWTGTDSGLIGGEENKPTAQAATESSDEGWLPYLGRNAAQMISTTPYSLARSYGGIGNIMNAVLEEAPMPEGFRKWALEQQRQQVPTMAQAREEAAGYLPKFATEMKPQDEWIQNYLPQAIIAGSTGGLSSWPALARTLGSLGGAEIGGRVGEAGLEGLGFPKTGGALGSLLGGHLGEKGAQTAVSMSSRVLEPKVAAAEEANIAEQTARAKEEYQKQKTAFEQSESERVARERGEVTKIHAPVLEEAHSQEQKAREAIPQEEAAFAQDKKQRIDKSRQDVVDYEQNIKTKQKEQNLSYKEAQDLRTGKEIGHADAIVDQAQRSVEMKGLKKGERALVADAVTEIGDSILNGTLTLEKAIELQKGFNGQIFEYGASPNFKRAMTPIVGELNKFIEEVGGQEHYQAWSKAENLTKEIKDLNKNKAQFKQKKTTEISDINKEKLDPVRKNFLEQQAIDAKQNRLRLEKEYNQALNIIGPKTWTELLRDENKQHLLEDKFVAASVTPPDKIDVPKGSGETALKMGFGGVGALLGYLGLGAVGGAFGTLGGLTSKFAINEINYARQVFRKYPSIKAETYKIIKDSTKLTPAKLAQRLANTGYKIQKLSETMEQPETMNFANTNEGMI